MEKVLYPSHPVRCFITGTSECGEPVFLTNKNKIYIYLPSLHQKLIKCFSNYIPIHIISNILNEDDIDIVTDEIMNKKDFEKSCKEIETFESIEELKFPQEYDYYTR